MGKKNTALRGGNGYEMIDRGLEIVRIMPDRADAFRLPVVSRQTKKNYHLCVLCASVVRYLVVRVKKSTGSS